MEDSPCEVPSPAISILSPVTEQVFAPGEASPVRFTVSGSQGECAAPITFALAEGTTKVVGQGHVRAFIDDGAALAETAEIPSDSTPFLVPGPAKGDHVLKLKVFYKDGTQIEKQREGSVKIKVQ